MKKFVVMMICCFAMVGLQAQETAAAKKSCAKTCTAAEKAACALKMGVSVASLESEGFSDVKTCSASGTISGTKTCSSSGKITTKSFNPATKEMTVSTVSADGEEMTKEVTIIEAASSNAAAVDTKLSKREMRKASKKSCAKSCTGKKKAL